MLTGAVALGSNLGNRLEHLRAGAAGLSRLPGTRLVAVSGVIETPALVPAGAPPGPPYLNSTVLIETARDPASLLAGLLEIERGLGRDRRREGRWGARTLDLDLLFLGDTVIQEPGLVLPHPRMAERPFVLRPLAEVAPDWKHPLTGQSVLEMLAGLEARAAAGLRSTP